MNIDELYTVDTHEAGAEMQVKDESGTLLDMFLIIAGVDSKAYREAESAMQREIREGKDVEEAKVDALVKVTIDWKGFLAKDKELLFSKDDAKKLYANAPYLLKQADRFLADRVNFTKGKATT